MIKPRVFAVSESLKYDPEINAYRRTKNLSPALKFGELVYLLPPGNEGSNDPDVVVRTLTEKLKDFSASDYLLPIGHPLYIAWAAAVAAKASGGVLNILYWRSNDQVYQPVSCRIPA